MNPGWSARSDREWPLSAPTDVRPILTRVSRRRYAVVLVEQIAQPARPVGVVERPVERERTYPVE
jgi:hypothetical protein